MPFKNKVPKIHPSVFVAPGAHVIGDVSIGSGSSVWFTAVLRGDINKIRVGKNTNIQDGCLVHVDHDQDCVLGDGIIMGHQATAHACHVGDGALIGIGSRILSGAKIGAFALIGAGSVVLEDAKIPERALVLGVPGKVVRILKKHEVARHIPWARRYAALAADYRKLLG